jgi:hypothetical protein
VQYRVEIDNIALRLWSVMVFENLIHYSLAARDETVADCIDRHRPAEPNGRRPVYGRSLLTTSRSDDRGSDVRRFVRVCDVDVYIQEWRDSPTKQPARQIHPEQRLDRNDTVTAATCQETDSTGSR